MALQGFVDGQTPLVSAAWLNALDAFYTTLFQSSTTAAAARAAISAVSQGAVTDAELTMAADRLLGRTTASTGAIEEISVTDPLVLTGGTLSVSAASQSQVGVLEFATQAEQVTGTSLILGVASGTQQFHQSAAKFWIVVDETGAIADSYNVTSVTDVGVGQIIVTITTDFSSANWCAGISVFDGSDTVICQVVAIAAGSVSAQCTTVAPTLNDPQLWYISGYGRQV